jgi:hypothetical protein
MTRSAQLLSLAVLSALLAPVIASGSQPLQAAQSGEAARDRVLQKHPVPDDTVSGATQIPGFFGAGDPLQLGTTQEPWDLDPLTGAGPQVELLPLASRTAAGFSPGE